VDFIHSGIYHFDLERNVHSVPLDYTVEMQFTEGTWQNYLDGRYVTLTLTKNGKETFLRNLKKMTQNLLTEGLVFGFEEQAEGISLGNVKVKKVSCKDRYSITMNLNTIKENIPDCSIKYKADAHKSILSEL
jgi:hypothetical protein